MLLRSAFALSLSLLTLHALADTTHHHPSPVAKASTSDIIQAGITPNTGIAQDKATDFTLHLLRQDNNQPITPDDLVEMHTKIVHLLIIDPSLSDYHHEHPVPAGVPGTYDFSFAPKKGGDYKAFVEITPRGTDETLYLPVLLNVTGNASAVVPNPEVKPGQLQKSQTVQGLLFTTQIDTDTIHAQQSYPLSIRVTDAQTNQPVTSLEPVMGAFAHMVGFSADRSQVVHVHPMGAEPESNAQRGGPDLNFHINFPTAGFYRLFAQVQVKGQLIFVPLDVQVEK